MAFPQAAQVDGFQQVGFAGAIFPYETVTSGGMMVTWG